ncbi:MAG: S-methyl-5'-thioadenosine phosphorylase [Candidatus Woesearchaeota archaeon]|nr:S-methyl-5'-thioadenosine phosphorylase [Candidatus Woesearchaeota archaeon]
MIAIIGGTGLYDPNILKDTEELKVKTPYGNPSDVIIKGKIEGKTVFLLSRHGRSHQYNPSTLPYRANIWALKELGVKKIIAVSAVGSLKEEMAPGDIVFTDQFIDMTKNRIQTFYGSVHLSAAEPFCSGLRKKLLESAKALNLRHHEKGTCVVIEGPRFSSRAESNLFRQWDADIINMTMVPESVLAREAEICYANVAMVTDYDCWKDHAVSHAQVLKTMGENLDKVKSLIWKTVPLIDERNVCSQCNTALKDAGM